MSGLSKTLIGTLLAFAFSYTAGATTIEYTYQGNLIPVSSVACTGTALQCSLMTPPPQFTGPVKAFVFFDFDTSNVSGTFNQALSGTVGFGNFFGGEAYVLSVTLQLGVITDWDFSLLPFPHPGLFFQSTPAGDLMNYNDPFGWSYSGGTTEVGLWSGPQILGGTPLPAALPLFATGLGALGLIGWRRRQV